jgi:hypothetical protein
MNRKTIIQIVVIVFAFGGSGFVLYNGLFKKNAPPEAPPLPAIANIPNNPNAPASQTPSPIPGQSAAGSKAPVTTLSGDLSTNLKILDKNGLQYGFKYPVLDPNTEIGVELPNLIIPASAATSTPQR